MSRQVRMFGAIGLVVALLLGLNSTGTSGGKFVPKELTPAEKLALASQLEAYGRVAKSPTALLTAAELYWSLKEAKLQKMKVEVKTEPEKEGDKVEPVGEAPKMEPLKKQAEELFKEALDLAGAKEKDGVQKMIDHIKVPTLGSVKGPHYLDMLIAGKSKQSFQYTFVGGQPAFLAFHCFNGAPLNVHIHGPSVNLHDHCVQGKAGWLPTKTETIHVHIHNPHSQQMHYRVHVN